MTKYLAIGAAIVIAALGAALWWQTDRLDSANKRIGELEHSNKQLTETVNAKSKATQGRAQTDNAVRKLAPADKLERLR